MYVLTEPLPLACSTAVTLLAGLVHDDGIGVLADRATINPFHEVAPGMPALGDPFTKVFASSSGHIIAGIAGTVVVPGANLLDDVRNLVTAAADDISADDLHTHMLRACTQAAPALRHHATLPATLKPFTQPVHTIILLGGRTGASVGLASAPQLVAYGVADSGPPLFQSLQRSVVYAPTSVQLNAEQMLLADTPATLVAEQVRTWGPRLRGLAPLVITRQRFDLSDEYNSAQLSRAGDSGVLHHRPPSPPPTTPRH